MNKAVVCMFVMGLFALSAFAREERVTMNQMKGLVGKLPVESPSVYVRENIYPYVTYLKTVPNWGGLWISLPYKANESIAVQIIRSSDRYYYTKSPVLVMCNINNNFCLYSNKTSLSFEISANEINRTNDGLLHFIVFGAGKNNYTASSVVVGLYACASKNTSLATCHTQCRKNCVHGTRSSVMDACVCSKGWTGVFCSTKTKSAPEWSDYEWYDKERSAFNSLMEVFLLGFIISVTMTILVCCVRACKYSHNKKLAQQKEANKQDTASASAPPPPPTQVGYAYYPLGSIPPPPPPSQTVIELPTIPAQSAVYCSPPVAPAAQVPVFVLPPPVPKN